MILMLTRTLNNIFKGRLIKHKHPSSCLKTKIKLTFIMDSSGISEETIIPALMAI